MKNPRIHRLKLANPNQYGTVNRTRTQDIYGAGISFMLKHQGKKEQKTLQPDCFNVYERENWLV
jgi:hypothetical protein